MYMGLVIGIFCFFKHFTYFLYFMYFSLSVANCFRFYFPGRGGTGPADPSAPADDEAAPKSVDPRDGKGGAGPRCRRGELLS